MLMINGQKPIGEPICNTNWPREGRGTLNTNLITYWKCKVCIAIASVFNGKQFADFVPATKKYAIQYYYSITRHLPITLELINDKFWNKIWLLIVGC